MAQTRAGRPAAPSMRGGNIISSTGRLNFIQICTLPPASLVVVQNIAPAGRRHPLFLHGTAEESVSSVSWLLRRRCAPCRYTPMFQRPAGAFASASMPDSASTFPVTYTSVAAEPLNTIRDGTALCFIGLDVLHRHSIVASLLTCCYHTTSGRFVSSTLIL